MLGGVSLQWLPITSSTTTASGETGLFGKIVAMSVTLRGLRWSYPYFFCMYKRMLYVKMKVDLLGGQDGHIYISGVVADEGVK